MVLKWWKWYAPERQREREREREREKREDDGYLEKHGECAAIIYMRR
jgi:hypothetical protein